MSGYMCLKTEDVPAKYNAGFSVYVAAWSLLENYPGHKFQTGLFGTWMFPKGPDPRHKDLYTDIEGGLGWWRDTRFPTATPKFIMGGVAPKFNEIANGPAHGVGSWEDPKGLYGVAQLSLWLLFPIDGLNVKQGTCGELFGYGYLPLPLTLPKSITAGQNLPTGDQSWTLFINTENFNGPVAFFTPYFWSRSVVKNPALAGLLLDSSPSDPNKDFQMETQYIPATVGQDAEGNQFARTAPIYFPVDTANNSVMMHGLRAYSRHALWDHVQTWFNGGAAASGTINVEGAYLETFRNGCNSNWNIQPEHAIEGSKVLIDWTRFARPIFKDPHTFGYCWSPEFVHVATRTTGGMVAYQITTNAIKTEVKKSGLQKRQINYPASYNSLNLRLQRKKPRSHTTLPRLRKAHSKAPAPSRVHSRRT